MPKVFECCLAGFTLVMTVLFTVNLVSMLRSGKSLWRDESLTRELRCQYYLAPPAFGILTVVIALMAFRVIGH